jgi:hypothetical protein
MEAVSDLSDNQYTDALPTVAEAKKLAKALRADHLSTGEEMTHGRALELVAARYGHRDWNSLNAAIADLAPKGWTAGGRVRGYFMGQVFEADVLASEQVKPGWYRLTLDLDEAIDVVTFESFSNFRERLVKIVGPDGTTQEKTSQGIAHLTLEM